MRILFDQGTPVPLRKFLPEHQVETAFELGWSNLQNGELLRTAEQAGFQVFVSTDRNLKHQQNLVGRELAIVVILSASWPRIRAKIAEIAAAVAGAAPGSYAEVSVESAA